MQASDGIATASARRTPAAGSLGPDEVRLQRLLKKVVVGLAILLFAGLALVVWRVIHLASSTEAPALAQAVAQPTLAIRPEQTLELPRGAQVRSVSLSGSRLAVHYDIGGASGIAVLDLQTGRRITNVAIEPAGN